MEAAEKHRELFTDVGEDGDWNLGLESNAGDGGRRNAFAVGRRRIRRLIVEYMRLKLSAKGTSVFAKASQNGQSANNQTKDQSQTVTKGHY